MFIPFPPFSLEIYLHFLNLRLSTQTIFDNSHLLLLVLFSPFIFYVKSVKHKPYCQKISILNSLYILLVNLSANDLDGDGKRVFSCVRLHGGGLLEVCSNVDLFCQLLDWMISHIEVPLAILVLVGVIYFAWLDGHTKGHRQGFIDGIMHHIQVRAYNAADFPDQYRPADIFLEEAQRRLGQNMRPRVPADIRDMPLP